MSDRSEVFSRVVAHVRMLLRLEWLGDAGRRFRKTSKAISDFAEEHGIRPIDLAEEAVDLGRRKLEGAATKELAEAVKDFADSEQKQIEAEFQRRALPSKLRRESAEARLAEIKVVEAELELLSKLKVAKVVLHTDADGHLTVLPTTDGCDLEQMRRLISLSRSDEEVPPARDDEQS